MLGRAVIILIALLVIAWLLGMMLREGRSRR